MNTFSTKQLETTAETLRREKDKMSKSSSSSKLSSLSYARGIWTDAEDQALMKLVQQDETSKRLGVGASSATAALAASSSSFSSGSGYMESPKKSFRANLSSTVREFSLDSNTGVEFVEEDGYETSDEEEGGHHNTSPKKRSFLRSSQDSLLKHISSSDRVLSGKNWTLISTRMAEEFGFKNKSAKQCRERWINHLDPSINRSPWTAEEEQILFDSVAKVGTRWAKLALVLPGRTENAVKNKYYSSQRKERTRQKQAATSATTASILSASVLSKTIGAAEITPPPHPTSSSQHQNPSTLITSRRTSTSSAPVTPVIPKNLTYQAPPRHEPDVLGDKILGFNFTAEDTLDGDFLLEFDEVMISNKSPF